MIEHIGYFKQVDYNFNSKITEVKAINLLSIYKDKIPTEEDKYCYRVTLIDGVLYVEYWDSQYKSFRPILCTNKFIIDFKKY